MCLDPRLFNCARCHEQVIVCTDCDRGQIYCANGCAELVRQTSLHAANARYQQSRKGKLNHAQRQRQYRLRQKEISKKEAILADCSGPLESRDPQAGFHKFFPEGSNDDRGPNNPLAETSENKVTYHTSAENSDRDVLPLSPAKSKKATLDSNLGGLHCHFCKKPVANFLRTFFLAPVDRRHCQPLAMKMT